MSNYTKKMLHLVKEAPTAAEMSGELCAKPRVRRPFVPGVHSTFHAPTMFHTLWETSNFFDMFLPEGVNYVEVAVDAGESDEELEANTAWFDRIGRDGLKMGGVIHRVLFGDWDDDGVAIMVPADAVHSLADMGLRLTINNAADKPKVRKYFRRIRAHHEWAVSGKIIAGPCHFKNGQVLEITLDKADIYFQMLHVDLNSAALGSDPEERKHNIALADGVHLIDVGLCQKIGKAYGVDKLINARVGDAFKGTALSYLGLGKGFFHVVDNPKFGIVVYGAKKQVSFDHFFLGSLGDVKGGDAFTDLQSMINFGYHNNDLAYNQAVLFITEVAAAIHDEAKLRHLVLTNMAPMAELLQSEHDRESWVLYEALKLGVPVSASPGMNPGLFRRVCRLLLEKVLDASKGRIPFLGIGARFNLMPDLNCFDQDGGVDYRRSSIPEDAVVCMDLNMGPMAMYRQPSGNPLELVVTTNLHDRRFRRFRGHNRVILGAAALQYMQMMGGGDMDDAINATDDLAWIETMANARVYPQVELPAQREQVEEQVEDNKYRRGPAYPRQWTMKDFFEAVAAAKERSLSIGPVVNALMLDTLLSGEHKENMLSDIADRIVDAKSDAEKQELRDAYDWLRARPDYQLAEVGLILESFVDYIKMGKGDPLVLEPLVKKITEVRDGSRVIPSSFLIPNSKDRVRVTPKRLQEKDFITAPSLVCATLARIQKEVELLQEALTEEQWLNVDSIPESLNQAFPRDRDARDEAIQLRAEWRDAFSTPSTTKLVIRYKSAIEQVVNPSFKQWEDDDVMMQLAVEHARLTYRGRKSQAERSTDGKFRNYPDGLLWTNTVGLYYIKAMELAGLTGLYVPVQFDRWSRNFSRGHFEVSVVAGVVIKKDDGTWLGTTMGQDVIEDGNYSMTDGMLTVAEPAAELRLDRAAINEEFDNPVELDLDFVGIN